MQKSQCFCYNPRIARVLNTVPHIRKTRWDILLRSIPNTLRSIPNTPLFRLSQNFSYQQKYPYKLVGIKNFHIFLYICMVDKLKPTTSM